MITKYTIKGKSEYGINGNQWAINGKEYTNYGGHSVGDSTIYYLKDQDGNKFETSREKLIKALLNEMQARKQNVRTEL